MSRTLAAIFDLTAFVAFVLIGEASHARLYDIGNLLIIGAPFVIAWFAVALATRLYVDPLSWSRTALTFVISQPIAYLLREFVFGRGNAVVFIIVTTAFMALLIFGWRLIAQGVLRVRGRQQASA